MTIFKVGDVVRVATGGDLNYVNSWSQYPITRDTPLVVKGVDKEINCLYFDEICEGCYSSRFKLVMDFSTKKLEDYL